MLGSNQYGLWKIVAAKPKVEIRSLTQSIAADLNNIILILVGLH